MNGTVLVVDDDPLNRTLLRRAVEREGHRVEVCADGQEAWERLLAPGIDLVLLDLLMPRLDGHGLLARLIAHERLRHVPVVVVSGAGETEEAVRCIELGADDFLPKPVDPVLLRARIGAGLARKGLRDLEQEYLDQVAHVLRAAEQVEAGSFDASALEGVATRSDALGRLARTFQRMALEVADREQRLRRQVGELRIEIDHARAARRVAEITETPYFADLQRRAADLRREHAGRADDKENR